MISANENSKVLPEKNDKKVIKGRMAGPFHTPHMQNLHISPVCVVSKADGDWRMIMHLSYPPSISINHSIDPIHTTVTYTSFDGVIEAISQVGKEAMISKCDIKSAFLLKLQFHFKLKLEYQEFYKTNSVCLDMYSVSF